jgi:hypothetical protein
MATFDIIADAGAAYGRTWAARTYLSKLIFVPIVLKFFCLALAFGLVSGEGEFPTLRFTLILLPATLVQGWMLAHFVRYLVLGQTWPFQPTGDLERDLDVLRPRARGVLSGMIVFTLLMMAQGVFMAISAEYFLPFMPRGGASMPSAVPPEIALLSALMLAFLFWSFRFLWLYIPAALNADLVTYVKKISGFKVSLMMIAQWIVCAVPFFLFLRLVDGLIGTPLAAVGGENFASFLMMFVTVAADTVRSLVVTAGMVFFLKRFYGEERI